MRLSRFINYHVINFNRLVEALFTSPLPSVSTLDNSWGQGALIPTLLAPEKVILLHVRNLEGKYIYMHEKKRKKYENLDQKALNFTPSLYFHAGH